MASNLIFDVEARGDGAELAVMAAQAEALKEALRELDSTVKAKVELTGASNKDIASIAKLRDALAEIDGKNARARVEVTGVPTAAESSLLRRTAKALRELDGQNAICRVEVTGDLPNPTEIRRAARALQQLQGIGLIRIEIEVTGATEALADVIALREALRSLPRRTETTVNARIDRDSLGKVGAFGVDLLKIAAAASAASLALGSALPAVASLGGSLASLAGLAPVVVGGLTALGVVVATVKAGMVGMSDAFSSMDDPAKFAAALKEMAPAGREFATAVRGIKVAFEAVQLDVQQKLFAGLGAEMKSLGTSYIPVLKSGMGGVATALNGIGKSVLDFAQLPSSVRDVSTIFDNTRKSLDAARPAAVNLLAAFKDIAVVGTGELPSLGTALADATGRFREFIAQARESGQLKAWIQGGADTLSTLGSIAGNVGSALYGVFTAAKASGADFLSTLDNVTEALAGMLRSATGQQALVAFFTQVRAAVDALMPGVQMLGVAVLQALQAFSQSGGLQAAAQALTNIAQAVQPLIPMLGALAGQTLGVLANGASMAAAALTPIVGLITGVVSALGPMAPLILASVVAFKALAVAGAGLAALGARVAATSAAVGLYTTALTGSMAAGGAANSATTALGKSLSALGKSLPVIGAAFLLVGAAAEQASSDTEGWAKGLLQGGEAAAQANKELQEHNAHFREGSIAGDMFRTTNAEITAEMDRQRAAMSPLQQAQSDLALARDKYNAALKSGNPSAVAAAERELAEASGRVATETERMSQATKSAAEQQRDLVSSTQSVLSSMLDLNAALRDVETAQKAANDAAKKYGENSTEAQIAAEEFVRKADSAAQAVQKQAQAQAEAAGATDAATVGTNAYGAALLQQAATASGPAQKALLGYITKLNDSQLAALSAGAEATGFATQIMKLPDGREVKIAIDPETGKIVSTQQLLDAMQDKTIVINGNSVPAEQALTGVLAAIQAGKGEVTINGKTVSVQEALRMVLAEIGTATGTVNINGQAVPAQTVLQAYLAAVNSGSGVVTINGQSIPADQVLTALLGRTNASTGTVQIDGNPTLANGKVTSTVKFADGSTGTITFDGNNIPANGEVTASVRYADGSVGTIQIKARDAGATATAAIIRSSISSIPAVIDVVTRMATGQGAAGGGVMGFSGGGIAGRRPIRAARGYVLPGYAPGRDTIPAVLSKGEAVLVPELVRMLGARRILDANAEASGGRRPAITGSIASMMDGVISGSAKTAATATSGVVRTAVMTASGRRGGGELAAAMAAVATLRSELATQTQVMRDQVAAIASARPVTVMAQPGNELAAGRGVSLAMRLA
ncbi:hypothetical protein [Pseudonocardia sp.]|uniref:hypothetical protein n=1 Tax=Pseudonocardia sp. TaxID=60912 RepID=UPI003D13EB78